VSLHLIDDPAARFGAEQGAPVASGGDGCDRDNSGGDGGGRDNFGGDGGVRDNSGGGVGPLNWPPVGVHGADRRFVYTGQVSGGRRWRRCLRPPPPAFVYTNESAATGRGGNAHGVPELCRLACGPFN
jgi:hypothetical protein